jgi:hypothetical protein
LSALSYAGVGSRNTPAFILEFIEKIAQTLAKQGYILRSGGADGADSAFEQGCLAGNGQKEIYLPWKGFNKNTSSLCTPSQDAYRIASETHPYFDNLKDPAKLLMARNTHQVIGADCQSPCFLVLCWTQDGADNRNVQTSNKSGGTGQAIRLAKKYGVPVHNLYHQHIKQLWEHWLVKNLSAQRIN